MIVSRREKVILYGTITVVVLAAVNWLFIVPFESSLSEIAESESKLIERKGRIADLLHGEVRHRMKIQEIEAIIPRSSPEEMSNEFMVHLRELAEKARLQVTDSKYLDQVSVMDKYKKMVFAIRFDCDILQLKNYLYNLETSPRLLRISQLDIVQRARGSEKLSVNMRLSTLVLAK